MLTHFDVASFIFGVILGGFIMFGFGALLMGWR